MKRLLFTILLAFAVCPSQAQKQQSTTAPNILLVTIDTLRADHLGCYGYRIDTSPNIDRIAKGALLFRNAASPVPLTLPAHTSILTGMYPLHHGIRDNAYFGSPRSSLVSELLKKNGYATAAFVSGAPLSSSFGIAKGFDVYDDSFSGSERKADATTVRAIEWLKSASKPYFLWIHYYDPHAEYNPPQPFDHYANLYDGEIAFVDSQIAKLWESAKTGTVLILTADHGESLGEHGESTHGIFLYNATLHVPLLIAGTTAAPTTRNDPVTLCDIAPTILKVAGVSESKAMDGASLLLEAKPRTLFAESLYAQRNFGYSALYAATMQNKKYIRAPQSEFYDLASDPGELKNISSAKTDAWKTAVENYASGSKPQNATLTDDQAEALRSLGYVGGSMKESTIDPKTKVALIERFNRAMGLLKTGDYAKAEEDFAAITTTEKQNSLGFRFLGDARAAQQQFAKAAEAYAASISISPDPETQLKLAKAYQRSGNPGKAAETLGETAKAFPEFEPARFEYSSLLQSQGQWPDALQLLQCDSAECHNQRGILYLRKQEFPTALSEFQEALKSGQKSTYYNNLGIVMQKLHRSQEAEKAYGDGIRIDSDSTECEANLAFLLVQQQRLDEALPHLQKITAANPSLWNARLALGYALEKQGRSQEAEQEYRKLLHDAPADWPQRKELEQRLRN